MINGMFLFFFCIVINQDVVILLTKRQKQMKANIKRKISGKNPVHWSLLVLKSAVQQLFLIKNHLCLTKRSISVKNLSLMMSVNENNNLSPSVKD